MPELLHFKKVRAIPNTTLKKPGDMLLRNAGPDPPALDIAFLTEMGLGGHAEDFV
jgi:hypothetical protein